MRPVAHRSVALQVSGRSKLQASRAGALELGGAGAQDGKTLADVLFARGGEHGQHALVAIDDLALGGQHEADGCELEGAAVIEGGGFHSGDLA